MNALLEMLGIMRRDNYGAPVQNEKKFVAKPIFTYGEVGVFLDGLTNKIPRSSVCRSIEQECRNYHLATITDRNNRRDWWAAYQYVVYDSAFALLDPDDANVTKINPNPNRMRDGGHDTLRLVDFVARQPALNPNQTAEQRQRNSELILSPAEVAVLRLYTGPFYGPWNDALRNPDSRPAQEWATCIYLLYGAILKLSQTIIHDVPHQVTTLYRGIDIEVPDDFSRYEGGVEMAFMSVSTELEVAEEYATRNGGKNGRIFEMDYDTNPRGARVEWCSQFPYEKEILYPPCTKMTCRHLNELPEHVVNVQGNDIEIKRWKTSFALSTHRVVMNDIRYVNECPRKWSPGFYISFVFIVLAMFV